MQTYIYIPQLGWTFVSVILPLDSQVLTANMLHAPFQHHMAPSCWTRATHDTFNVWISCAPRKKKAAEKRFIKKGQKKKTWPCIHGCDKQIHSLENFHFCNLWRHWFAPDHESWLWFYNNGKKLTSMRSVVVHENIINHTLSAIVFLMHTILHRSHVRYPQ